MVWYVIWELRETLNNLHIHYKNLHFQCNLRFFLQSFIFLNIWFHLNLHSIEVPFRALCAQGIIGAICFSLTLCMVDLLDMEITILICLLFKPFVLFNFVSNVHQYKEINFTNISFIFSMFLKVLKN